ncbi:MAG: family 78 glycoside hydrolase catalytic domain [Acidobacteriota bacterium]
MRLRAAALVAGISIASALACDGGISVRNLTCDNRPEAAGVGVDRPVFGWEIASGARGEAQRACRILVAASPELCQPGRADVWDSGRLETSESQFVPYGGKRLDGGRAYFWKVGVWGRRGRAAAWSAAARFVTELAGPGDWSGARWIAYEELPEALKIVPGVHGGGDDLGERGRRRAVVPAFRRDFVVRNETVARALVFVSGLGHYELRLNGRPVGDSFLAPGWTDYRKTCLYDTYDVTDLVKAGRNAIGAIVGPGFFNVSRERYRKLVIAYGWPMLVVKLDLAYASGRRETITSGPDWRTAPSPVAFSSIYGGEDYDARLEAAGWDAAGFDDSGWRAARPVAGPEGALEPERDFPLKVEERIEARRILEPRPGVFVYDFGQNASGIVALKVRGRRGATVTISPGELLSGDGTIDQRMSGAPYRLVYTLKGEGDEEWRPRFTYYGFRYAQVEGAAPGGTDGPADAPRILGLTMLHTRNSAPSAGSFSCSKELFNRTFALIDWAIRSNLASVPTDCPHREKLGWLEQTHLMGGSIQYNYRILTLYRKLVRDMMEAQLDDGLVPDIAPEFVPFVGGFRDSPEWGSAAVILPWLLYEWYGDRETMASAFPMMRRYVDYLDTKADGHILSHGLGDWCDLGPRGPGEAQLTPKALTATAMFYRDLDLLARMASLLGRADEAASFARRAEDVRRAFNGRFYDAAAKVYSTGSQTSFAMPLHFGMVEPADRPGVFANLVRSIRAGGGALTAGDVGFDYLLKALEDGGASDLVFEMNAREDVPGYGYQLARGATALTESWAALREVSNDHMMLGHLMEWFYSDLAGIRQAAGSKGFETVEIAPRPVGDIAWVKARYHSIRGEIACDWRMEKGRFFADIVIPANARALVRIPAASASSVEEGGVPAPRAAGVAFLKMEDGRAVFAVGSGSYRFASNVGTAAPRRP